MAVAVWFCFLFSVFCFVFVFASIWLFCCAYDWHLLFFLLYSMTHTSCAEICSCTRTCETILILNSKKQHWWSKSNWNNHRTIISIWQFKGLPLKTTLTSLKQLYAFNGLGKRFFDHNTHAACTIRIEPAKERTKKHQWFKHYENDYRDSLIMQA